MGIQYDDLAHGPFNFRDGLEFFEDIKLWADAYERRVMVPNKWNHKLAEETAAMLMADVPGLLRPHAKHLIVTLMDERLRRAMMYVLMLRGSVASLSEAANESRYDDPPAIYPRLLSFILKTRQLFLRYLMLPRPYALRYCLVADNPDPKTGRYYTNYYDNEPW